MTGATGMDGITGMAGMAGIGGGIGATGPVGRPGAASPIIATGPYLAITSPSRPYAMRKKNAGIIATTTPNISVGANRTKNVGIMNKTPHKRQAFLALRYRPLLMLWTVVQ